MEVFQVSGWYQEGFREVSEGFMGFQKFNGVSYSEVVMRVSLMIARHFSEQALAEGFKKFQRSFIRVFQETLDRWQVSGVITRLSWGLQDYFGGLRWEFCWIQWDI